jgi:hypothetical protein
MIIIVALLYFIPTFIVLCNKHPNGLAIGLLNLFLGWTFVGWLVCLIWAVVRPAQPQTIIINNANNAPASFSTPPAPYAGQQRQALPDWDRTAIYSKPEDLTKRLENFEI